MSYESERRYYEKNKVRLNILRTELNHRKKLGLHVPRKVTKGSKQICIICNKNCGNHTKLKEHKFEVHAY